MAKQKISAPIKAIGLAKQALPDGTAKEQRALADRILELNNQKRGEAFKVGENVSLGKGIKISAPSNSGTYDNIRLSSPANFDPNPFVSSTPSPVSPTPAIPQPEPVKKETSIKPATPDIIISDLEDLPVDLIIRLTLEKIGGQELINIARHDTVNGQNVIHQIIKNLQDVSITYNPQNLISFPDSSDTQFKNFAIKLEAHIPQDIQAEVSTDMFPKDNNVYYNPLTQSIVIESVGLKRDYDIEVQMLTSGKIFNDTIYNEDLL